MLKSIRIQGLGPHKDTILRFCLGVTELAGPSESGKTMTLDAVLFALWGMDRTGNALDARAINDDADELRVDLVLQSGTKLTRILRRSKSGGRGSVTRTITTADGVEHPHTTEKSYLGAIGALGSDPKTLRHVLTPMAWVPLMQGAGGGRPLRDLFASVLPPSALKEVWQSIIEGEGFEVRPGDPINPKDAEELRRRANSNVDRLEGDVNRMASLVMVASEIDVPDTIEAEALLKRSTTIGKARRAWLDAVAAAERAQTAQVLWDNERAALVEPEAPAGQKEIDELQARRSQLTHQIEAIERSLVVQNDLTELQANVIAAQKSVEAGKLGRCACCDRAISEQWLGILEQKLAAAQKAYDEAVELVEFQAEKQRQQGDKDRERLQAKRAEVVDRLNEIRSQEADRKRYDRAIERLGARPEVPPVPPEPEDQAPTADELEAAQALIARAGAAKQRQQDTQRLRETLDQQREALDKAKHEAKRLDAIVTACRVAPSEATRRQLLTLGDIAPAAIELDDKGGAKVTVDGRPWHLASTGRQVVADIALRAGMRRAIGLPWLPLFVDHAQDVGGQPLPKPAPCVVLWTTDDEAIAAVEA